MKVILLLVQIVVAALLAGLILLQSSKGGLGSAFGGGELYHSKRGAERVVFTATIITAVVFLLISIGNVLVQ